MALTATGVGSGLDIESLVTKLMQAERLPKEQRLLARETDVTNSISGLASLKGALSELQTSLAGVNSLSTFEQRNVTSDQSSAVTAVATKAATLGGYSVTTSALASSQSLAIRANFSTLSETVGTGSPHLPLALPGTLRTLITRLIRMTALSLKLGSLPKASQSTATTTA